MGICSSYEGWVKQTFHWMFPFVRIRITLVLEFKTQELNHQQLQIIKEKSIKCCRNVKRRTYE